MKQLTHKAARGFAFVIGMPESPLQSAEIGILKPLATILLPDLLQEDIPSVELETKNAEIVGVWLVLLCGAESEATKAALTGTAD